jgi:hypothetical protein
MDKFVLPFLCAALFAMNQALARTYTTNFPETENPIFEKASWVNGQTIGLDWANVRTTNGLAFGIESGTNGYDDSTALLTGDWGSDQSVQATVHTVNQSDKIFEEVELRLRSSLSAHSATGYEINFRCSKTGGAYVQIVRWNGPLGKFSYIAATRGPGLSDGDVVKAAIIGKVITVCINGVKVLEGTDDTYAKGNPGIGFYLEGTPGVNGDYGFTSFTAADEVKKAE